MHWVRLTVMEITGILFGNSVRLPIGRDGSCEVVEHHDEAFLPEQSKKPDPPSKSKPPEASGIGDSD